MKSTGVSAATSTRVTGIVAQIWPAAKTAVAGIEATAGALDVSATVIVLPAGIAPEKRSGG
ncbi:MAG: hypothetical protein IPF66_16320 [Holophagales bacterium]|nr:hypothetical protein [Holophagales bacterium]